MMKKRGLVTIAALAAGVALAGFMSSFIESPKTKNEFLHEHLSVGSEKQELSWVNSEFSLPVQEKIKIENIIKQSENLKSDFDLKTVLTGQALKAALSSVCTSKVQNCSYPLRINRQLTTAHMNKDMRVINVKERSHRIDFKFEQDSSDISFQSITNETRVLRFYQTQAGWIQNVSMPIQSEVLSFSPREDKFRERFEQSYTGLNYYPASASWMDFWKTFPVADIEADLEVAKSLNVNGLRIFLTHDYFNDVKTHADGLSKLETFLDMCEAKNIQVLITLFDLRPNYAVSNWQADIAHIDKVISSVEDHNAVLAIDLKNQPDLDFENWGQGRVEGWLTVMARHIQTQYPDFAVTAGWSRAENAFRLQDVFDLITYHEYQNPKGLEARLQSVVKAAAGKPVMITELGSTTWHPPFIARLGERAQASRLKFQLSQAKSATGVFIWTLNDFDNVGKDVVGPLPWRRAQQKHFGLRRADKTLRPAAGFLKAFGQQSESQSNLTNPKHIQTQPL